VFIVAIVCIVCVAVANKIELKCCYSNETYSAVHKVYKLDKSYIILLGILILLSVALYPIAV
jgi:hypothetical protein